MDHITYLLILLGDMIISILCGGQQFSNSIMFGNPHQENDDFKFALRALKERYVTVILPHELNHKIISDIMGTFSDRKVITQVTFPLKNELLLEKSRHNGLLAHVFCSSNSSEGSDSALNTSFRNNLDFMIESSFTSQLKYLLIIIGDKIVPESLIFDLLAHAWNKKFLDVTVLQRSSKDHKCNSRIIKQSYNPFRIDCIQECLTSQIILFSDKLSDMHQYPLKIAMLNETNRVNLIKNASGHVTQIRGIDYAYMTILSEKLNFSIQLVTPNVTTYEETIDGNDSKALVGLIADGEIDLSGNQIFLPFTDYHHKRCEKSTTIWFDKVVILAPLLPRKTNHFYFGMILCLGILIHVAVICTITKFLGFELKLWSPNHVIRIILGHTIPRISNRSAERFFFFFLAISSQNFAIVLFGTFTNNHIENEENSRYDTIQDLVDSDVTIVSPHTYVNVSFDSEMMNFLKNKFVIDESMNCPGRIMSDEDIVCLIDRSVANYIITKSRLNGDREMKLINHIFWKAPKGFILSNRSPFVRKINRVLQQMEEGGLWIKHRNIDRIQRERDQDFIKYSIDRELSKKLLLIWFAGCTLSIIVFFIELVIHRRSGKKIVRPFIKTTSRSH
ncbi:hypothetical protein QAD02_010054 [Eretmocerus hayati]|uniref:Uncharacterized protein n=1 Tax=Eretmocerus hayati TaxID=131215 RepID=A0ACC2NBD9_9HYME|nr:hypothetical protein QAD02_010054 [Eretmocerus hayati]